MMQCIRTERARATTVDEGIPKYKWEEHGEIIEMVMEKHGWVAKSRSEIGQVVVSRIHLLIKHSSPYVISAQSCSKTLSDLRPLPRSDLAIVNTTCPINLINNMSDEYASSGFQDLS